MLRATGVLAFSCFLAACTDTSSTLGTTVTPSLLTIDPANFRGAVGCGAPELQAYVVALTDVSNPLSLVPVSTPTTCPNLTSFGTPPIVVNDFYVGAVDGYDRPTCDVAHQVFPAGCVEPSPTNSRQLLDHATGAAVAPRWQWQCGTVAPPVDASVGDSDAASVVPVGQSPLSGPTQALLLTEVFLQGCLPLVEGTDASTPEGGTTGETDAAAPEPSDATSQPADAADDATSSPAGDAGADNAPDGTPSGD